MQATLVSQSSFPCRRASKKTCAGSKQKVEGAQRPDLPINTLLMAGTLFAVTFWISCQLSSVYCKDELICMIVTSINEDCEMSLSAHSKNLVLLPPISPPSARTLPIRAVTHNVILVCPMPALAPCCPRDLSPRFVAGGRVPIKALRVRAPDPYCTQGRALAPLPWKLP